MSRRLCFCCYSCLVAAAPAVATTNNNKVLSLNIFLWQVNEINPNSLPLFINPKVKYRIYKMECKKERKKEKEKIIGEEI